MKKYCLIYFLILFMQFINGDDKVDPKLDFQESKEDPTNIKNNKTLDINRNTGMKTSSPKIQGVRVTVDTGNLKKSKEYDSNESAEIIDGKNTRKIGIHTDITFEISDDKDSKNVTADSDIDDTDASVPVFKGRIPTSTKKPTRKPYDPRTQQWLPPSSTVSPYQPSFSTDDRFYPRPQYNPSRIPVFTRTHDKDDRDIYRSIDSWSNFVPITSVWTTERTYYPANYDTNYYQNYQYNKDLNYQIPSSSLSLVYHQQQNDGPQWKPCYCFSEINKNWKNKRNNVHSSIVKVNSRLENPFSDRKRRK